MIQYVGDSYDTYDVPNRVLQVVAPLLPLINSSRSLYLVTFAAGAVCTAASVVTAVVIVFSFVGPPFLLAALRDNMI